MPTLCRMEADLSLGSFVVVSKPVSESRSEGEEEGKRGEGDREEGEEGEGEGEGKGGEGDREEGEEGEGEGEVDKATGADSLFVISGNERKSSREGDQLLDEVAEVNPESLFVVIPEQQQETLVGKEEEEEQIVVKEGVEGKQLVGEEGGEQSQLQTALVSDCDSNSEVLSVEEVQPSLDISDIPRTTPTGQEDVTPTLTPTLSPQPPTLPVAQHRPPPLEPSVTVISTGPSDGDGEAEGGAVAYGLASETADQPIPELPYSEEVRESRDFRLVSVGGEEIRIDLRQLQPYRKIVQHAGGCACVAVT